MNWWQRAKTFLAETRSEMRKVTFPSRDEVTTTTVVVIIASFVFAIYLFLADTVILWLYELIFEAFS